MHITVGTPPPKMEWSDDHGGTFNMMVPNPNGPHGADGDNHGGPQNW